MLLELKNVEYSYKSRYQTVDVLKGVSCRFEDGCVYGIIGKSGCGKSTVLSLMAGMLLPQAVGSASAESVGAPRLQAAVFRKREVAQRA